MRIVVTGAGGFLGTELLRQLLRNSYTDIVAATAQEEKLRESFADSGIAFVAPDRLLEEDAFISGDVVFNCAFPRNSDGYNVAQGLDYLSCLIENVSKSGIERFINISSQSVYDQHRNKPAKETDPLCLQTAYAVAKRGIELLVNSSLSNISHTNIRLASLIGAGFDRRIPNRMTKSALETGQITVMDNGSTFGFMDVRDAAGALVSLVGDTAGNLEEVYNLSNGSSLSLVNIAEAVAGTLREKGIPVSIKKETADSLPVFTSVDSAEFDRRFHWQPRYTLQDTVCLIAEAMCG